MKDKTIDLLKENKQKVFSYLKLILSIMAFIFTIGFQIRNSQNSNIVQGTISQLQVLISIIMVIAIAKKGYIAAMIINATQSIVNTIRIITTGDVTSMLGVIIPIITMIIISILSFFIRLLHDKVKIVSEAQSEISQQNKKLKLYNDALKENEKKLHQLAFYDSLTGLPNRKMIIQEIESLCFNFKGTNQKFIVVFVDLDNFKKINDTRGHDEGDELLRGITKTFKRAVNKEDLVGRLGGDEFALIIKRKFEIKEFIDYLDNIRLMLFDVFIKEVPDYNMSASFGVSIYPRDGSTPKSLLKAADIAMYKAKELGKNRIHVYSQSTKGKATKNKD